MERLGRSPGFLLVMLVCVLLEWLWRRRIARVGYDGRGALASLAVGIGNVLAGALSGLALASLFAAISRLAPVHWPVRDWRVWLAGFVAVEFAYYGYHRCSHTIRWMWANHAVHHTPEQMTLLSAVRLGWTHLLSFGWVFYVPLVLAGLDPRMVFALLAFDLHYQFFLHTEAVGRLGVLEWVLNTPAHHRVHHASNAQCLDKNYGGVLIIYDRVFGTFARAPADEPLRYGLLAKAPTYNPVRILFREWLDIARDLLHARSPAAVWRAVSGRP